LIWGSRLAFAFDTLAYAKLSRERVIDREHAEATKQFIMAELVTKVDLLATRQKVEASIRATRQQLETTRQQLEAAMDNLGLRLTVRLGIMLAAALGAIAALIKQT
jgi:hypothetical protein